MEPKHMNGRWKKTIPSPIGDLTLVASSRGLTHLYWDGEDAFEDDTFETSMPPSFLKEAEKQLGEYFAKKRTKFTLPLDLNGTPFQKACWTALTKIPFGETRSYQEQAVAV